MKINEMNLSKKELSKRALKENFEVNLNFDNLDIKTTKAMLVRVRGLISESRTGAGAHARHQNPAYMKAVMMEQALTQHYGDLRVQHQIMLENEEVQKSQVLLAAQDMIDSVQKMIVDISKMKVEELPAVVTGVNNEIGTSEGATFEGEVQQALTTLEGSLTSAKQALTQALSALTGEGGGMSGDMGGDAFGGEEDMGGMGDEGMGDMGDDVGGGDLGGDMGGELPEMPEEEPEELGNAGRKLR
jgi:hypothetical protein